MYWDISLHIDAGPRPGPLANPAHYLILFGLFGVFAARLPVDVPAAGEAVPDRGPKLADGWYAPLGGVLIAAAGAFSLIGFPLDDVWHRLFGQDVTLWGPTHLMLIGGAAMTLSGRRVLLVEAAGATASARRRGELPGRASMRRVVARRRLADRPVDVPGRVRLRRAAVPTASSSRC